jgi:hypothetical protein
MPRRNLDPTGLEGLRHLALEFNDQEPMLKGGARHLDVLGQVEGLPEGPGRDAAMQNLGAFQR